MRSFFPLFMFQLTEKHILDWIIKEKTNNEEGESQSYPVIQKALTTQRGRDFIIYFCLVSGADPGSICAGIDFGIQIVLAALEQEQLELIR